MIRVLSWSLAAFAVVINLSATNAFGQSSQSWHTDSATVTIMNNQDGTGQLGLEHPASTQTYEISEQQAVDATDAMNDAHVNPDMSDQSALDDMHQEAVSSGRGECDSLKSQRGLVSQGLEVVLWAALD